MKVYIPCSKSLLIIIFLPPALAVGVQVHLEAKILNGDFKADKQVMFVVTIIYLSTHLTRL